MTELDATEKYASAALLTLALYSSQVEVGVDRFHEKEQGEYGTSVWGCPDALDLDEVIDGENITPEELVHFWGWDCCGKHGLCQSIYQKLNIPQKSWIGLLKIPETVADVSTEQGIEDLIQIVEHYSRMLDPELRYTKGSAVQFFSMERQRSIDVGSLDVVAAGAVHEVLEGSQSPSESAGKLPNITESSDTDVMEQTLLEDSAKQSTWNAVFQEQDNSVIKSKEQGHSKGKSKQQDNSNIKFKEQDNSNIEFKEQDNSNIESKEQENFSDQIEEQESSNSTLCKNRSVSAFAGIVDPAFSETGSSGSEAYEQYVEALKLSEENPLPVQEDEDVVIPKAGFIPRTDYHHPASGQSCLALRALIRAALLEQEEEQDNPLKVCIQWYDSRCRIALMRVSHWLRIPWTTMTAFEMEAAMTYLKLQDDKSIKKDSKWTTRWLKISAMAISGGAAVAFTGGLAAPAVAAGLGAAVTLAGGTAATATAVTGFAASTAGTATITTAFGAFGAHSTGSTMYHRTNTVKEFAFWDLSMDWEFEIDKKKANLAKNSSKFWSWTRPSQKQDLKKTQSKTDLLKNEAPEGYVPLSNGEEETGPSVKKVQVVPGVEIDPDELAVTKSTNNYTEWWENWLQAKERPDLLAIPVNPRCQDSNLALTIAMSGIIRSDLDFVDPWKRLPTMSCDRFSIVWESQLLKKVSDALLGLITSQVANETAKWFIKKYLYTGLLSAVAIPVLITTLVEVTVGNNWATAMDRSLRAGELLAEYLMQGLHGNRPVTLVGYSLGARSIFRCLLTLYRHGKRGIIENVILLGAPVSLTESKWAQCRSVIAGRFINGYSTRDWVLSVIFRVGRGILQNVGGISPVNVPGVENVDLSAVVGGQTEYSDCMKDIFTVLNL